MPSNNHHNPLFGGRNQTNNNDDDDDDLEKLDMEMEEEELVFENQNMQDVDLENAWGDDEYWPLRIKSVRDIRIEVQPIDTVAQVKETVLRGLGREDSSYVRLVCKGRLLAPDSAPIHSFGDLVQPNDVIHAVLTDSSKQRGVQAALQQGYSQRLSRRALRSAGINASGLAVRRSAAEQEQDDDDEDEYEEEDELLILSSGGGEGNTDGTTRRRANLQRRGFDRLRSVGLRRAEINALRAYFSRHVDRFVEQNPDVGNEPEEGDDHESTTDALLRRRRQEEAWMQAQGPLSEFRLNLPSGHALALMALLGNNNGRGANGDGETNNINTSPWLNANNAAERELWRAANGSGTIPSTGSRATNNNGIGTGNDRDFLCGFLLGFFVGFIMLVWVWMPTVPHKQKLGILTGITVQLALALLRPAPLEEEDDTSPDSPSYMLRHSGYAQLLDNNGAQFDANGMDDGIVLG